MTDPPAHKVASSYREGYPQLVDRVGDRGTRTLMMLKTVGPRPERVFDVIQMPFGLTEQAIGFSLGQTAGA